MISFTEGGRRVAFVLYTSRFSNVFYGCHIFAFLPLIFYHFNFAFHSYERMHESVGDVLGCRGKSKSNKDFEPNIFGSKTSGLSKANFATNGLKDIC